MRFNSFISDVRLSVFEVIRFHVQLLINKQLMK